MSVILALDTSGKTTTVALHAGGTTAEFSGGSNDHCENLAETIQNLLTECGAAASDITEILVGVGPGSFTGLRIGLATAKGLAVATNARLLGYSSLGLVAANVCDELETNEIYIVADAQRNEVFHGGFSYENGKITYLGRIEVCKPSEINTCLPEPLPSIVCGNGIDKFNLREVLESRFDRVVPSLHEPRALRLIDHFVADGAMDPLTGNGPMYVRKSEAEIKFPDGNPGGSFAPRK